MPLDEVAFTEALTTSDVNAVKSHFAKGGTVTGWTLTGPDGYAWEPLELAAMTQAAAASPQVAMRALFVTRAVVRATGAKAHDSALTRFASENHDVAKLKALLAAGVAPTEGALRRAIGNGAVKNVYWLIKAGAPKVDSTEDSIAGRLARAANGGQLRPPFDFIDLEKLRQRVRVWVSWLATLPTIAAGQTFYAVGLDGGQLVANTEEALAKSSGGVPERVTRLRFSFGDYRFRTGYSLALPPSTMALNEAALARRSDDDDRTESQVARDWLWHNRHLVFAKLKRSRDFRVVVKGHPY